MSSEMLELVRFLQIMFALWGVWFAILTYLSNQATFGLLVVLCCIIEAALCITTGNNADAVMSSAMAFVWAMSISFLE